MTMGITSPTSTTGQILKNGSAVISFDANNNATFSGNVAPSVNPTMRNRMINGGFQVWQRSTSSSSTNGYYTADRWYVTGTANVTVSKSANPTSPNGNYYLTWTTSGASTFANVGQCIESVNITDLRNQTVTISAWIQLNAGTYNGAGLVWNIYTNTSDALSTTTPVTVTTTSGNVIPTGTWQQITASFVVPSTCVSLTCFLNNNAVQPSGVGVNIADVQLEKGTLITPFEQRLYGIELALCQRYYQQTTAGLRCFVIQSGNGVRQLSLLFPTPMRASPTVAGTFTEDNGGSISTSSFSNQSTTGVICSATSSGGSTGSVLINSGVTISAEL